MHKFEYPVLDHEVIDGDSVHVWLDMGFGVILKVNARMTGVDCPEKNTEAGKMIKLVVDEWTTRRENELMFWSTDKPKYARRAIGELYSRLEPSETLSRFLINAGIARPYDGAVRPGWGPTDLALVQQKCHELLKN